MRPEERQARLDGNRPQNRPLPHVPHWRLAHLRRAQSQDEDEAREVLEALKHQRRDSQRPEPFEKVLNFLEDNLAWLTVFLRHDHVQRNSLAESGTRVLRRLEIEHGGFRSDKRQEDFLRTYQAIKYLGWSVYDPPDLSTSTAPG